MFGTNVPVLPAAFALLRSAELDWATEPTAPEAATPLIAFVIFAVTAPALLEAVTPDSATVIPPLDTVPVEPDASTPDKTGPWINVPTAPEDVTPDSAIDMFGVSTPSNPEAVTPVNATDMLGVTVPTEPVAKSPAKLGTSVPTAPDDATPVSATVTSVPIAANGAEANGERPNMV
jgi:hypothetical protein